jgi:hypothetical protein
VGEAFPVADVSAEAVIVDELLLGPKYTVAFGTALPYASLTKTLGFVVGVAPTTAVVPLPDTRVMVVGAAATTVKLGPVFVRVVVPLTAEARSC